MYGVIMLQAKLLQYVLQRRNLSVLLQGICIKSLPIIIERCLQGDNMGLLGNQPITMVVEFT